MTDKEIIKYLACCENNKDNCCGCQNYPECFHNKMSFIGDALDLIKRQRKEVECLKRTLSGVMYFVDKWLDWKELEQDEVNRAATMREKTLRIVEEKQAEIERLIIENQALRGAANSYKIHYEGLKSEIKKLTKAYRESQVSNLIAFVKSLCKDRVSNDTVVIAAQVELKEWLGESNE